MTTEFEKRVGQFARDNRLFTEGGVVAAVSGGADSTALLVVLAMLRDEGVVGGPLVCVHLHHGLRGDEADGDEAFAGELSRGLGVKFVSRRIDVPGYAAKEKVSIETAGRYLRIAALGDIAAETGCSYVATGHHKDDNAETVAQRLSRGTAYRGLCGIRPVTRFGQVQFVRPLLCCRRSEIEDYLRSKGLPWRTDRTNTDCGFRRNFIRHRLLPELAEQAEGDIVEGLWRLSQAATALQDRVSRRVQKVSDGIAESADGKACIDAAKLTQESPVVQVEIVRRALVGLGSGQRDLNREHYERIIELAHAAAGGRKVELPGGFEAAREHGRVVLSRGDAVETDAGGDCVELEIGGQVRFCDFVIESRLLDAGGADVEEFRRGKDEWVEWLDADRISGAVVVRRRRQGDRFEPLGLGQVKKVGKFLTAEKIAAAVRRQVLVLADDERILWVCPVRMSESAKVTDSTRRILEVRVCRVID